MKPQIRPDQVCAELWAWHVEVVPHRRHLHMQAYPPPSSSLDAVRVQQDAHSGAEPRWGDPAVDLWHKYERLLQRQRAASEAIEHRTGMFWSGGTVWQRFCWGLTRREPARLADEKPCPQPQWLHDRWPALWHDLEQLLLDMAVFRSAVDKQERSGRRPNWIPGDAQIGGPFDTEYRRRKLHDRQARGLSEMPTERGVGLQ